MGVDVAWVSHHAMERYRRHFPEAVATDVMAATSLSIPLSKQLADALAGRRSRPGELEGEARLLHPAGSGIFVLCALREQPDRMYVKTYLRLDGAEQRRMARGWFLEPTQVLREAFELGYRAAQAPDAPPMAVQASEAHLDALVALAPRLGAPALGTIREEETSTRVVVVQEEDTLEPAMVFASATERTQRVFQDFVSGHVGFRSDVGSWGRMSTTVLGRFLEEPHVQGQGVQVLAAHLSDTAIPYREVDYTKPTALLLGTEKFGVSDEAAAAVDQHVIIPMMGMVESFNVSVAAAIILAEACEQRRAKGFYDQPRIDSARYHELLFRWGHEKIARLCDAEGIPYPELDDEGQVKNSAALTALLRQKHSPDPEV